MGVLSTARRAGGVATTALATTATAVTGAAGAIAGGATGAVLGGINGATRGLGHGLTTGSQSTPAAVLAVTAVGATGLIDWPVLLLGGGAALAVRHLKSKPADATVKASPAVPYPARTHTPPADNRVVRSSGTIPKTNTPAKSTRGRKTTRTRKGVVTAPTQ